MRVSNCAECEKVIEVGEIMFPVYWSVDGTGTIQFNFICQDCMKNYMREGRVPGGRV